MESQICERFQAPTARVQSSNNVAIELFAQAMRTQSPRGRAGGLARARTAWRYFDDTFMSESNKFEAYSLEYERYAAGERARAASAIRNPDGTFVSEVRVK